MPNACKSKLSASLLLGLSLVSCTTSTRDAATVDVSPTTTTSVAPEIPMVRAPNHGPSIAASREVPTLSCDSLSDGVEREALQAPGGRLALEVGSMHSERVIVRQLHPDHVLARIDPNPAGETPNCEARFVAGDNVLVSWSCGTYCSTSALFTAEGQRLATMGIVDVDPANRLAVEYEPFDQPMAGTVRLWNLKTGVEVAAVDSLVAWNTCSVMWGSTSVTLKPCDVRTEPIDLSTREQSRSVGSRGK